jgi:CRISPR type III-B/RAMP module RAMP protein Cmr1
MAEKEKFVPQLEVVTPVFLAGADTEEAEVRTPAMIGVWRFWFRAVMGGIVGDDLRRLRDLEARLFGGVDATKGEMHASSVRVVLEEAQVWKQNTQNLQLPPSSGAKYLLYSPFLQRREYIVPGEKAAGSEFKVRITARDANVLDLVVSSFWLATWLGAVGMRSRRGAGVLAVVDPPEYELRGNWPGRGGKLCMQTPGEPSRHMGELKNGIDLIQRVFREHAGRGSGWNALPSYDVVAKDFFYLGVVLRKNGGFFASWIDALEEFGITYRDWRAHVRGRGQGRALSLFGLPLRGVNMQLRRASPLWIRPVRYGDNRWGLILMVFKAQLLENNTTFNDALLSDFLKAVSSKFSVTWVNPYKP